MATSKLRLIKWSLLRHVCWWTAWLGQFTFFVVLACHLLVLDGFVWHFQASVHTLSSAVNKSQQLLKTFGNAENQTRGCWVRSANATSVLCSPPSLSSLFAGLERSNVIIQPDSTKSVSENFVSSRWERKNRRELKRNKKWWSFKKVEKVEKYEIFIFLSKVSMLRRFSSVGGKFIDNRVWQLG